MRGIRLGITLLLEVIVPLLEVIVLLLVIKAIVPLLVIEAIVSLSVITPIIPLLVIKPIVPLLVIKAIVWRHSSVHHEWVITMHERIKGLNRYLTVCKTAT